MTTMTLTAATAGASASLTDHLVEVRDLRRTTIKGTGLTAEQVPALAAE